MPVSHELDSVSLAYQLHAPELQRFAVRRLRDQSAAEDVVHEAYLRLAAEARSGRFPRQPRAWLYRTTLNLVISGARRAAVARAAARLDRFDVVDHDTPESVCLSRERDAGLASALRTIGSEGQTGLRMAAEGYSGREIARSVARSEVATRAMLHRARLALRAVLVPAEVA